jgi:hypothetical protein
MDVLEDEIKKNNGFYYCFDTLERLFPSVIFVLSFTGKELVI